MLVGVLVASACGGDDPSPSAPGAEAGEAGQTSSAGAAVGGAGAGGSGLTGPSATGGEGGARGLSLGGVCTEDSDCASGLRCALEVCVRVAPCGTDDDCRDDHYCDADAFCVPYGLREDAVSDPECARAPVLGALRIEQQCRFDVPPDDQLPASRQVMATPALAELALDRDAATSQPTLVFATFAATSWPELLTGDLRLVDGQTCEVLQTLMGDDEQVVSTARPALADLDGDRRAEIVMPRAPAFGGLIAFSQADDGTYQKLWTSALCDDGDRAPDNTHQNEPYTAGVAIHDLDDDGVPEILLGAIVYDAAGCVLDAAHAGFDVAPVVADLNQDGVVELATGDQLLEWRSGAWAPAADFAGTGERGFTALADFGDFGEGAGVTDIAVSSAGTVRIENVFGEVVFGPIAVPGLSPGGPPRIGDFDGDGEAELAVAGSSVLTVLDLECDVEPLPSHCESRGVRWSKPSRALTSAVTGSAAFDFEGDGVDEALAADECFLRIYDGVSGAVKWSIARPSRATGEYPLVADVDGDFNSELVVGHSEGPSDCPDADPLFPSAAFEPSRGLFVYHSVNDDWAPLTAPDLTLACRVTEACSEDGVTIGCDLCNRGARGVAAGVEVVLESSELDEPFCRTLSDAPILPGACTSVTCAWDEPPRQAPALITAHADASGAFAECFERNNLAFLPDFVCREP